MLSVGIAADHGGFDLKEQLAEDLRRGDYNVPGEPYSFGVLKRAQALGDLEVLRKHGRRVVRIHLGDDVDGGLKALAEAIS